MEPAHEKDEHRFSVSRLKTFKTCPRKHHYMYIEKIHEPDNEFTICGSLFHKCLELILTGEEEQCQEVYQEFADLCRNGVLQQEPDLLQYIVDEYFRYYGATYLKENTLAVEKEYKQPIADDDYFVRKIDQILEVSGLFGIRDYKTTLNTLKYEYDDVKLDEQLLTYVPAVEEDIIHKIDFIEIDEVRLAKLQEVPLLKNGKPSTNKGSLSLVAYEDYLDALTLQGLEDNEEYKAILDWLKQRGHPLFNRIRVQLLDRSVIDSMNNDMNETYLSAVADPIYRCKGPLCNFCAFKHLCELDYYNPSEKDREAVIAQIESK